MSWCGDRRREDLGLELACGVVDNPLLLGLGPSSSRFFLAITSRENYLGIRPQDRALKDCATSPQGPRDQDCAILVFHRLRSRDPLVSDPGHEFEVLNPGSNIKGSRDPRDASRAIRPREDPGVGALFALLRGEGELRGDLAWVDHPLNPPPSPVLVHRAPPNVVPAGLPRVALDHAPGIERSESSAALDLGGARPLGRLLGPAPPSPAQLRETCHDGRLEVPPRAPRLHQPQQHRHITIVHRTEP